ncbi:MAG: hypothetical protein IH624_01730 [Phycisphaerae bacterium]|nr:hypothetical protein [Phycisphaerae bacterium]
MESMKTAVVIAAVFGMSLGAAASTSCDQKFTFLGLTRGSQPILWVAEELGGECLSTQLVQVILDDPNAVTVSTEIPSRQVTWLKDAMKQFATEAARPLDDVQGLWMARGATWYVKPPNPRSDLSLAFSAHVAGGGSNGISWNKERGLKGVVAPEVGNAGARLIYSYPAGLYFNYTISQAYFFPRSGHLVVFTHQKLLAVGLDTMHGFMVLKITQ